MTLLFTFACLLASMPSFDEPKDEVESIRDTLAAEIAIFDNDIENAESKLLAQLRKKADDARQAGKKDILDQAKTEIAAFEANGELPKLVSPVAFHRTRLRAVIRLESAYDKAIRRFTIEGFDDEADAAENERSEFLKEHPEIKRPVEVRLIVRLYDTVYQPRPNIEFRFRKDEIVNLNEYSFADKAARVELVAGKGWKEGDHIQLIDDPKQHTSATMEVSRIGNHDLNPAKWADKAAAIKFIPATE